MCDPALKRKLSDHTKPVCRAGLFLQTQLREISTHPYFKRRRRVLKNRTASVSREPRLPRPEVHSSPWMCRTADRCSTSRNCHSKGRSIALVHHPVQAVGQPGADLGRCFAEPFEFSMQFRFDVQQRTGLAASRTRAPQKSRTATCSDPVPPSTIQQALARRAAQANPSFRPVFSQAVGCPEASWRRYSIERWYSGRDR